MFFGLLIGSGMVLFIGNIFLVFFRLYGVIRVWYEIMVKMVKIVGMVV